MTDHEHPLPALERLDAYIGRENLKEKLRAYTRHMLEHATCSVLYFEADGGLGKTRLLQLYPQIIYDNNDNTPLPFVSVRVCQIVDFYSFQNRVPSVIESQLIDGLKLTAAGEPYRLPASQVDAAFQLYYEKRQEYEQAQDNRKTDMIELTRAALRDAFVTCWNALAGQHPLVMCFDTLETLFLNTDTKKTLAAISQETGQALAGIDLVLAWMGEVLPRLQHTLVLLSGRPVQNNQLARQLSAWGLMQEPVQRLDPFARPTDIRTYLAAYGCEIQSDADLHAIQRITLGRPLLLTCLAETRRSQASFPTALPAIPAQQWFESQPEFEHWLIDTLLNPIASGNLAQSTLAYSLYFLVYARRGIRVKHLIALFERLGESYDAPTIAQLEQVALVKRIGDLLFLHDEIFVMIDASQKPREAGLREPTLDYLCDISARRVAEESVADVLGPMADHMYYELTRDFERGYRTYAVYIDRLLENRTINDALVFSDAFWRTLDYTVWRERQTVAPYRDALLESDLTEERLLRDEQVRQVELLRALDKNVEALELAERLWEEFTQQGILPAGQEVLSPEQIPAHTDLYLFVTLSIKRVFVFIRAGADYEQEAERLCDAIIPLLELATRLHDTFLEIRRLSFLGHIYTARGQLRRNQKRFTNAQQDAEKGWSAFKRYLAQPETRTELNDYMLTGMAQVMNNLAYSLARSGNLKRALRLSNELISERGDYIKAVSDYQRALFYNTNGLINIRNARYLEAKRPLALAQKAAEASKRHRAQGLVTWAQAQLKTSEMKATGTLNLEIEELYVQAETWLEDEHDQLPELYHSWSSYARDLASLYRQANDSERTQFYEDKAMELLNKGIHELGEHATTIERAELLESQATVCNVRGDYDQARVFLERAEQIMRVIVAPEYAQVISGRIAIQYADIYLHHDKDYQKALYYMCVALARAYVFAETHRDQDTLERLIDRFIEEIPDDELLHFEDVLDTLDISVASLPYHPPDTEAWRGASRKSIRQVHESITTQLDL